MSDLEQSPNEEVRRRAAWWLGEHESRRAVQPLIESLDDPSAEVRQAAAWALGEIKDHQAIEPLIRNLDDHDPLVREMAVLSLGEIEDPSAVGPLVRTFDEEADLRIAVIWALGEIEGRGSDEARTARRRAFDRLGRDPWPNHQVWAGRLDRHDADRIRSHAGDFDELYRLLGSGSATNRREATLAIGLRAMEHPFATTDEVVRTVDLLLDTLQDPIPEVRAAAVLSLDEINPSRARSGIGLLQ